MTKFTEGQICPLCGRIMIYGNTINQHHLVPKTYGGIEKFYLHRICHSKIHACISEKELKTTFNTFEKLRTHPEIAKFIHWVRRRPPDYMARHS